MFAYCGNNPINRSDPAGHSWLAAAVGGGIAGAIIGATSYLISNGISGNQFDTSDFLVATSIGAINGFIGGAAGTLELVGKTVLSVTAGIIAGTYTAINTDGTTKEKILSGLTTGIIAAASTFTGASIDTGELSAGATIFANYATTMSVATPAEVFAIGVQQMITAVN